MIFRVVSVMRKEFMHILRDRRTLAVMFLIPVIQLLLMGYAATTDIKHLQTAVWDQDQTARSRELIEAYRASSYFDITHYVSSDEELAHVVDNGDVRAGIIIPAGYGRGLEKGEKVRVAVVIDGSDPSVAGAALSAAESRRIPQNWPSSHGLLRLYELQFKCVCAKERIARHGRQADEKDREHL